MAPPYRAPWPIACSAGASHYFLNNDGPAKEVVLRLNEGQGSARHQRRRNRPRPPCSSRMGGRWLRVETAN